MLIDHGRRWMVCALDLAQQSFLKNEVPVGALIIKDNQLIASSHNLVEEKKDITAHAEMLVIQEASKKLSSKYLNDCTLIVTLEPCVMCAQAISHAKIKRVIYAAYDEKAGAIDHGVKLYNRENCFHKPEVISGIMEEESKRLLHDFFQKLR